MLRFDFKGDLESPGSKPPELGVWGRDYLPIFPIAILTQKSEIQKLGLFSGRTNS